ncbi:MAG: YitT family protein [Rhodoferax sp.]|nr:YitT family protein [Rhodoferax sp.]
MSCAPPSSDAVALAHGPVVAAAAAAPARHRAHEDVQALVSATLLVAFGVVLFGKSGLLTGGTAGLAFLLGYASGMDFGVAFFLVNLPFYWFAWRRLGAVFTLKTFAAVSLLSVFAQLLPHGIGIDYLAPGTASVLGGLLCGVGMLILFRHRASLGGVNVLVLHLQERYGWRAGTVQMAIDGTIVAGALWITDWQRVAWSVLGAVVLNLVLAVNHRPGRYVVV